MTQLSLSRLLEKNVFRLYFQIRKGRVCDNKWNHRSVCYLRHSSSGSSTSPSVNQRHWLGIKVLKFVFQALIFS